MQFRHRASAYSPHSDAMYCSNGHTLVQRPQARSVLLVGRAATYWSGRPAHSLSAWHLRSDVAVGGIAAYSDAQTQILCDSQPRSEEAVGAVVSHSPPAHLRVALHWRSDVFVGAIVSYSFGPQPVTERQTRSASSVSGDSSNSVAGVQAVAGAHS